MDKRCVETFQELTNMQSKISSLFQDILVEKYHYKLSSDKLKKNLEEISSEVKNLKEENEKLHKNNQELKNVINECIKVFQYLDFSQIDLARDHQIVTDTLKRILSQNCHTSPESGKDMTVKMEMEENKNMTRCNINQDDVKKEIDAIKDLKFDTEFFDNDINEEREVPVMNLEKLLERKSNEVTDFDKHVFVKETETPYAKNGTLLFGPIVQETADPLSEMTMPKKNFLNSPVFKDFGIRRQDSLTVEVENCIDGSRPKMVNEIPFLKKDLFISPLKKPELVNNISPKRARKKLRMESPRKSPVNQLKKSNSREAEISTSDAFHFHYNHCFIVVVILALVVMLLLWQYNNPLLATIIAVLWVRKLTQTILNIECFKKKTPEKINDEEIVPNVRTKANEPKASCDIDEDDVIMESPKKSEQMLEDMKSKKKLTPRKNDVPFKTPTTSGTDLDETYMSSTMLKKCHVTGKHILEKIYEDETPKRAKSPDSVPFVYKREAVRSKVERMKLPGHACLECNKYYKNALGDDINPRKLKEILNKCSRHRDKLSPSHDDTPPGYWKPYLTASISTSPNKDDTIIQ